jgi:hypothetical protein
MRRNHDGARGNLIGCGAGCSSPFDPHRFAALLACAHKTRFAWQPLTDVCRKAPETSPLAREKVASKWRSFLIEIKFRGRWSVFHG